MSARVALRLLLLLPRRSTVARLSAATYRRRRIMGTMGTTGARALRAILRATSMVRLLISTRVVLVPGSGGKW
jgi:hypothetical protein